MQTDKEPKQFNPLIDTMPMSMIVGKIPASEGLWGAIERLRTCDSIRNGTLVVFSHECSGRIGVFCNRYLTGAVIDSTGEKGLKPLKSLLGLQTGMFCFRPCWGDESTELGQRICVDIEDVLAVRNERGQLTSTGDAIQAVSARAKIDPKYKPGPEYDTDEHEQLEPADNQPDGDASIAQPDEPAITAEPPSIEAASAQEAEADQSASQTEDEKSDADQIGYLDWAGAESSEFNLRKILLPVMNKPPSENVKSQIQQDLDSYRQVLEQEERKVHEAIESTIAKGLNESSERRIYDDMQLLANMLHSQEEMISQRWQGLDDIPTPKTSRHMDVSGEFKAGGPRQTSKEFLSGCADLIDKNATRYTDPREFIKKADRSEHTNFSWLHQPKTWVALFFGGFFLAILTAANFFNSVAVETCMSEGKQAMASGDWAHAAIAFGDALAKDPTSGKAKFYRGIALLEQGEDKKAAADFKSARASGVPAADVAIAEASAYIRREAWDKAVDVCDATIKSGVDLPAIRHLRANANMHQNRYKEALIDCDQALSKSTNDDEKRAILADRGYCRLQTGDYAGAVKDLEQAVAGHSSVGLCLLMGDAQRKSNRFADAIESYSQVLDLDSKNYDAYVARGICEAALHRKDEALKDFSRALEIRPDGVEAFIQRGSVQLASGDFRQAVDDLQTACDLNPTIPEAQQKLSIAYTHLRGSAPKHLLIQSDTANRKLPNDPRELTIVGYNALNRDDLDFAIECLTLAVKGQSNNAAARRYLAYAFVRAGNFDDAVVQFKALLALQPLTDEDVLTYADALEGVGNAKASAELLSNRLVASPENIRLRARLAKVYYRAGQEQAGDQIILDGLEHAATPADKEQLLKLLKKGSQPNVPNFNPGASGSHG